MVIGAGLGLGSVDLACSHDSTNIDKGGESRVMGPYKVIMDICAIIRQLEAWDPWIDRRRRDEAGRARLAVMISIELPQSLRFASRGVRVHPRKDLSAEGIEMSLKVGK
jgi:hypothetical protein